MNDTAPTRYDTLPEGVREFFERSTTSLSLADRGSRDQPLVAINEPFSRLTGYRPDDVVGRNCRFLQPEGGAGPVRERVRAFLDDEGPGNARFVLANITKDGRKFVNLLFLTRLAWGKSARIILGAQFDLTRFHEADPELFDRARETDIQSHRLLGGDGGPVIMGTLHTLAASAGVIAQSRFDQADD